MKPNPEYIKRLKQIINNAPYFSLLSMEMRDIGLGYSTFAINIDKKHMQPFGAVHGGVLTSIIDSAAFWAAYYGIEDQTTGLVSVDLKLNFLAPALSGRLIAEGRQIKLGKTLGYAEAKVLNEKGQILAHGTSTLMVLPGKGIIGDSTFPAKFIE